MIVIQAKSSELRSKKNKEYKVSDDEFKEVENHIFLIESSLAGWLARALKFGLLTALRSRAFVASPPDRFNSS